MIVNTEILVAVVACSIIIGEYLNRQIETINAQLKVNAINKSLTKQNVPANRHVRQTVREDLIRQSKSMPNGENNPTIKKLIKRLDDADKEEKKQEDIEIPGTPPPPTQDTTNITRPIRKPPIYPPGMGHGD